jgi:hypothetical protein
MHLIYPDEAREMIEDNIPLNIRNQIVPIIFKAYSLSKEYMRNLGWKEKRLGKEFMGYLVHYAVQFEIINAIESGFLKIQHKVSPNSGGNCFHLEMITPDFVITQSQVESPKQLPRKAYYRENLGFSNGNLLLELDVDQENRFYSRQKPFHMIITHGYNSQEPKFIFLGIPLKNEWVSPIDMLKDFKSSSPVVQHGTEEITEEHLMNFKRSVRGGQL